VATKPTVGALLGGFKKKSVFISASKHEWQPRATLQW
jgi:hypothetical protein